MRKRKILDLSLSEFCSWPEAGLLHPALLSSPKSVQAPAVGPGIPRQGQGEARRAGEDSSAQFLAAGERGEGAGLLLAARCLCGRREDMCAHGGVSEHRACLTLLPLRNEATGRLS